jgi:hypothetical protein
VRGAAIEPASGRVPAVITVTPATARPVDFDVRLTYSGAALTGPRGEHVAAGAPYSFGYATFFVPIDWRVSYYAFAEDVDPGRDAAALARVVAGAPVKTDRRDRLDYESGGAIAEGVPRDRVAVIAEGDVELPRGTYLVRTISDDGIRVWMDGERIIDHWTSHESAIDRAPIAGGSHRFKVEYYELGGFAELRFEILRR